MTHLVEGEGRSDLTRAEAHDVVHDRVSGGIAPGARSGVGALRCGVVDSGGMWSA